MLIAIWAQDKNNLIGSQEHLPWHLPNDLRFFKETTINHTLVMGRKTFEGMGGRPLPNRQTIVLTSNPSYEAEGVLVMHSVDEVLSYAQTQEKDVFIAGGSAVYQLFLPHCDKIYRTWIDASFEGDTYFPAFSFRRWKLVEKVPGIVDENNPYPYFFETYIRTQGK